MSWQELQTNNADKAEDATAARQRLAAACRKALAEDNPEFIKMLRRIAESASYAPGRSEADTAFAEGKRAVAVTILRMGGMYE